MCQSYNREATTPVTRNWGSHDLQKQNQSIDFSKIKFMTKKCSLYRHFSTYGPQIIFSVIMSSFLCCFRNFNRSDLVQHWTNIAHEFQTETDIVPEMVKKVLWLFYAISNFRHNWKWQHGICAVNKYSVYFCWQVNPVQWPGGCCSRKLWSCERSARRKYVSDTWTNCWCVASR